MKIVVYNVAAENGGALSVLIDFYSDVISQPNKNIEWLFIVSKPELNETNKVKVLKFPWVKNSWLHRIYFDLFIAHRLIKNFGADRVISLQNIVVPFVKVKQIAYIHNSIPFLEYKFNIIKNSYLWIYQNIIGIIIKMSVKKADNIIVQSEWMKDAISKDCALTRSKTIVIPPQIRAEITSKFSLNNLTSPVSFFYPASSVEFKNHKVIIDACSMLSQEGIPYKVFLTVTGNENKRIGRLRMEALAKSLNVEFIGQISRDEVFKKYESTVLLFPSYVESSPLPLSEALLHNCIIVASNCKFSKEVLCDYDSAQFFDPFDAHQLSLIMRSVIEDPTRYFHERNLSTKNNHNNIISQVISV